MFSVTVPASLALIVDENGTVFAANSAAISNNSTGDVAITNITVSAVNGWTLAPYNRNTAGEKVDSRCIGFSLNRAATTKSSSSETLTLVGDWTIARGGTLPLTYDAVVSALSQAVNEQVLTVVFVINWAEG
jgi:hypothetical protein